MQWVYTIKILEPREKFYYNRVCLRTARFGTAWLLASLYYHKIKNRGNNTEYDMLNFFKISLKDYRRVAAFYPTPRNVVRKVLSKISPGVKYFIEYGAGNGAFTREILKRLPEDGKLVAIETNEDFVEQLKKLNDPRLVLFPGDVRQMPAHLGELGLPRVDVIISGIPFSRMSKKDREEIIHKSWRFLAENGVFVTYQNIPIIMPILKSRFRETHWYVDPSNLFLPYFVIFAKK